MIIWSVWFEKGKYPLEELQHIVLSYLRSTMEKEIALLVSIRFFYELRVSLFITCTLGSSMFTAFTIYYDNIIFQIYRYTKIYNNLTTQCKLWLSICSSTICQTVLLCVIKTYFVDNLYPKKYCRRDHYLFTHYFSDDKRYLVKKKVPKRQMTNYNKTLVEGS